ncbi:MAG: hypothetical protein V3U87_09410 [Methylococcaceae bacterium]
MKLVPPFAFIQHIVLHGCVVMSDTKVLHESVITFRQRNNSSFQSLEMPNCAAYQSTHLGLPILRYI